MGDGRCAVDVWGDACEHETRVKCVARNDSKVVDAVHKCIDRAGYY